MKAVVVLSGGLDSTVLLADALDRGIECYPLFFNYGAEQNFNENHAAVDICRHYGVRDNLHVIHMPLNNMGITSAILRGKDQPIIPEGHYSEPHMKTAVLPFRNAILMSIAVSYADSIGISEVYFGTAGRAKSEGSDCSIFFTEAFAEAAKRGTKNKVIIRAPFLCKRKKEVVAIGHQLNVPFATTWTCYTANSMPCGKCGACSERLEGFKLNNLEDPVEYLT